MNPSHNSSYLYAVFLGSTAFVFLNFGLPIRADDLGISAFGIGGMYAVFTGTMLLVRPVVGFYLDRLGRRWFFATAFLFYAASMAVMAQSIDIYDFYLARFLQGIGASLMWVSVRTIIADLEKPNERGAAMGKLTTTSVRGAMLGAMYGFTLLGFMPMQSAWVWAFAGYSVFALFGWVWALYAVPESKIIKPTQTLPKFIWTPELRKIMVIVFVTAFGSALLEPIYLLYLKNKFDLNVMMLAAAFFPAGLVHAIVPGYAGRWADRWGRAPMITIGMIFAGITSILLPLWPSIFLVAAAYILFAVGWSIARPAEEALVADLAPPELRGSVIGAKELAAGVGASLGPLAGGLVYDNWSHELAFVVNGSLLILAGGLAHWWFSSTHSKLAKKTQL
jgi:MFS family permease